jgi:hypothetical protein
MFVTTTVVSGAGTTVTTQLALLETERPRASLPDAETVFETTVNPEGTV